MLATVLPEIATAIATDAVAGGVGLYLPDVAGVNEAEHFVLLDANKAQDELRGASLLIGATGAEVAVTATPAELNVLSGFTGSAADIEAVSGMETELGLLSGLTVGSAVLNAVAQNPGTIALAAIRIESAVENGETVTIGADVYEFNTADAYAGANIEVDVSGGSTVKSQGTLVIAEPITVGDTMQIGSKVYTFVPDGTANADGEVNCPGVEATQKLNIVNAIEGDDGWNDPDPLVTCAAAFAGDDLVLTAIIGGTAGDAIDLIEGFTHASNIFDAVTMGTTAAGVDPTAGEASDALLVAINASSTEPVKAYDIDANELLLLSDDVGVDTTACAEDMSGANNTVDAALRAGSAGAQLTMTTVARVPTATEAATGNLFLGLDYLPTSVIIQVRTTATGALVAWDGAATIVDDDPRFYVQIDNTGGTDWSVAETLYIVAFA